MNTKELKNCIEIWNLAYNYHEPYEALIKENLYNKFLNYLEMQNFSAVNIYRGTTENRNMKIDDILVYNFATSWSLSYDEAHSFIEELNLPVIFQIKNVENIKAVLNDNELGGEEVIVSPINMKVINKYEHNSTVIFGMEII